jgi:hypothetical protein
MKEPDTLSRLVRPVSQELPLAVTGRVQSSATEGEMGAGHDGRPSLIHPGLVAVGCGGQAAVCPKERAEVTLICTAHLESDLTQRQVGLGQQVLGGRYAAGEHVLVRAQPGGLLEEPGKMGRARLAHRGQLRQG